uniref:DUF7789 domain-containing protein n=1 Tax=Sarcophilus harrisii TaxID=9305 RepID=A0A7N4PXJ1_SARHA
QQKSKCEVIGGRKGTAFSLCGNPRKPARGLGKTLRGCPSPKGAPKGGGNLDQGTQGRVLGGAPPRPPAHSSLFLCLPVPGGDGCSSGRASLSRVSQSLVWAPRLGCQQARGQRRGLLGRPGLGLQQVCGSPAAGRLSPEQARFVVILLVGFFDVICAVILIRTQGMMAFRVGGALESLQAQYFMLNLCFSMLTFDLQAQLCLCVLILTSGLYASLQHSLILVVGVLWAGLKVTIGILAILRELKVLVWIFLVQNVPEVAYLFYLLYTISRAWGQGSSYTGEAAAIVGSCISVAIKSVLLWALVHVYRSFGQGLRERMFSSYGRIES